MFQERLLWLPSLVEEIKNSIVGLVDRIDLGQFRMCLSSILTVREVVLKNLLFLSICKTIVIIRNLTF